MMLHASLSIQNQMYKEKRKEKKNPCAAGHRPARQEKNLRAVSPPWRAAREPTLEPRLTVSAAPTRSLRATRRPEPSPPAAHSSVDRSFALRTACLTSGSAVVSGVVLEWVGHRHRHGTRRTSGRPACGVTSPHRLTGRGTCAPVLSTPRGVAWRAVELPAFAIPRASPPPPARVPVSSRTRSVGLGDVTQITIGIAASGGGRLRACLVLKNFYAVSITSNLTAHTWSTKFKRKKTNCTVG